ncbi:MAG: alpha-amylase [Bacteroidetes bacterium]|nr:alpha-amylase [Bacteroidota bacterium]
MESTGNVVLPNYRAVRELAYSINVTRGVLGDSSKEVRAGFLNAAALLDEIGHYLVRLYDEQENPGAIARAYRHLETTIGTEQVERTLLQFVREFPPKAVYMGLQTEGAYLHSVTSGRPHTEIALEELMMLYLSNINPANKRIKELFDDTSLIAKTRYIPLLTALEKYFAGEKPFGPDALPLLDVLKRPILEHPENIEAQLGYIRERWKLILSTVYIDRITGSAEFAKEEEKFIWHSFHRPGGKAEVETFVPEYRSTAGLTPAEQRALALKGAVRPEDYVYAEPEQFTPDTDWMPNVVLIAKNTYVWLDQLTKKYGREIKRLDQIPDAELDQLAAWHFTSLWLIGVWERSVASRRIKQITGNLDAVSSAYSLYDYEIAADIGGEEAFQDLNRRCWQRGIRLAGDMVPNHMGLYSKWVLEHPEYFIQSEHSPYPNYRFTGENLSHDSSVELRIEDGYWSRSDAAVVFQRIDRRSGEVRYFYHGNDGTSMPWNDTAQLNLLRADVREAVIQSIFHVARKFSVIRFDAAMTLAKKHFQRLWYPMPGTSGVPSRQDHSLSRAEFDAMFPNEFWREVVDRFNAEMPQTLLLAEAFWLMEGYFVRTLGMHRVYNSAFMHMLMKQENQKFRAMIKNTLEFNPEILKRYVNFMSNPDEQTAVEQFGKDDKYFGVATLMVTLPGLPMFAHGQVEGFKEKYGMEYQRAYYNETPDEWLVRRHEHEVFPLTKKRYLFSQVHNFEFYDFLDDRGGVNEEVIAYSNRAGEERAVIFFHNTFAECSGYIKHSLLKAVNEQGNVRSLTAAQSLGLRAEENVYYRFRNRRTDHEYLISGRTLHEQGFRLRLQAFEYAVLMDFRELTDETGDLKRISERLNGNGTTTLDAELQAIRLTPLHTAFRTAFQGPIDASFPERYEAVMSELSRYLAVAIDLGSATAAMTGAMERFRKTAVRPNREQSKGSRTSKSAEPVKEHGWTELHAGLFHTVLECNRAYHLLPRTHGSTDAFTVLQLEQLFQQVLERSGAAPADALRTVRLLRILVTLHGSMSAGSGDAAAIVETLLGNYDAANFIGVHQYQDVWYYNKESFAELVTWYVHARLTVEGTVPATKDAGSLIVSVLSASDASGYQVERLREIVLQSVEAQRKRVTKKGNNRSGGVKSSTTKNVKRSTAAGQPKRKTTAKVTGNVKNITKRKPKR